MKCTKCGNEITENAKFCRFCGAKVEETVKPKAKFCAECGEKLVENAKFCNKCGAKVASAADKVTPVVIPVNEPVRSVSVSNVAPVSRSDSKEDSKTVKKKPKKVLKRVQAFVLAGALVFSGVKIYEWRKGIDTDESSSGDKEGALVIDNDTSPGNPSLIGVSYS